MPDATLTPEAAPDFVEGLSSDIVACVLLDSTGDLVAVDEAHRADGDRLAELGKRLLACAGTGQVEVSTGTGIVFALRHGDWTLVTVTGRFALSSLVFFDMRKALEGLSA